ncbi:MAG: cytochrome C [Opitutaceae bacterium]|nr:cytochrome C [Opitutaceae bacterium]
MDPKGTVRLFLDDNPEPIGEFSSPVTFELDTRLLADGNHVLKILSKDPGGLEGVKLLPFVVRNGPAIDVEGLKPDDTVDGVIPLMINAYGKGDQKQFVIYGSESPRGIPSWVIILLVLFAGWSVYYLARYLTMAH